MFYWGLFIKRNKQINQGEYKMKSEEALEQIEFLKQLTDKTRLKAAYSYPYFILWGILSIIGYVGSYLLPMHSWGMLWGAISVIGSIITAIFAIKYIKKYSYTQLSKRIGLQCLILLLADILLFRLLIIYGVYELLSAYWPFQFGIIYIIASIHIGRDLTLIGLWMIIISFISFLFPASFQNIWFALTYGSALLFTGIMFRYQLKKAGIKEYDNEKI